MKLTAEIGKGSNYSRIVNYFRQLTDEEKDKLLNDLKKERLADLLSKLRKKVTKQEISLEEITKEVETVRKKRNAVWKVK